MDVAVFKSKIIINLEYLSAEDWVEGYHLKESLLNKGTAKNSFSCLVLPPLPVE